MNRRGFTLVEVILVIAILSLLVLVLVPNIFVMIEKNNVKSCNNLKNSIESAAKIYVANNKYDLGFTCGSSKNITLQTLIDSGDLTTDSTGKIINPVSDSEILLTTEVEVTYNCTSKVFSYEVKGIECK